MQDWIQQAYALACLWRRRAAEREQGADAAYPGERLRSAREFSPLRNSRIACPHSVSMLPKNISSSC